MPSTAGVAVSIAPSWRGRELLRRWAAVGVCALALVSTSCSDPNGGRSGESLSRSEGEVIVTERGFETSVEGVTVAGRAGVAPVGTLVDVSAAAGTLPAGWEEFATLAGTGVRVSLGKDRQPQAPIELSFENVEAGEDVFVLSRSSDGATELLDRPTSGSLVATTDHLSEFWPIVLKVNDFIDSMFSSASAAIELSTPEPECFVRDGNYVELSARVSPVAGDAVWPCLERAGNAGVALKIASNSATAWTVQASSTTWAASQATAFSAANLLAQAIWSSLEDDGDQTVLLLPGESARFSTPELAPTTVTMTVDAAMSQVRTIALALDILLPQEIVEVVGRAECIPDLIRSGVVDEEPNAAAIGAIIRCFGDVAGGAAGAFLGLVAAPGALFAQFEGLLRTIIGTDELTFSVTPAGSTYVSTYGGVSVVDPTTGEATEMSSVNVSLTDIAFVGDQLYGISFTTLYKLDPASGKTEPIAELEAGGANSLISDGKILYAATLHGDLLTIDPEKGVTKSTSMGSEVTSSGDLVITEGTSALMTATGDDGDVLMSVDLASGQARVIGPLGVSQVYGLGIVDGELLAITEGGDILTVDAETGTSRPTGQTVDARVSGLAVAP
ncbi:hypothetical protein GKZ92_23360 (plasmid) [Gordonia sp. 135]|uniref:hypothetical protein n=1 Tax=Gordonia sp. 135 TaxID=2676309 RepID=UPI0012BB3870|nr:hypothetical protein [Gordonia sp. 135]QGP90648.1 hypothetical protein GKZ92_23360 [Gordonia sp. 135]